MIGREDAAAHWIIRKETLFKPCLCDKVAAHATLSREFVAHSRDKIARENCRCDVGLSALLAATCFRPIFSALYAYVSERH